MFGVGIVPEPAAMAPTKEWLGAMTERDEALGRGPLPQLLRRGSRTSPSPSRRTTVERLRAAKANYDPENLFHANHPVVSG